MFPFRLLKLLGMINDWTSIQSQVSLYLFVLPRGEPQLCLIRGGCTPATSAYVPFPLSLSSLYLPIHRPQCLFWRVSFSSAHFILSSAMLLLLYLFFVCSFYTVVCNASLGAFVFHVLVVYWYDLFLLRVLFPLFLLFVGPLFACASSVSIEQSSWYLRGSLFKPPEDERKLAFRSRKISLLGNAS